MDGLSGHLFECGHDGLVIGHATLVIYSVSDGFIPDHPVYIIIYSRISQSGHQVFGGLPFLLNGIQVAFHEYRAALPQSGGIIRFKSQLSEFLLNINLQFFGLLFQEGTCPRGTNLIHFKIDNDPVLDLDIFGILSPYFKDGIHFRIKHDGACGLCGDFILNTVRPDEVARQVSS